jgi:hypothetical protein
VRRSRTTPARRTRARGSLLRHGPGRGQRAALNFQTCLPQFSHDTRPPPGACVRPAHGQAPAPGGHRTRPRGSRGRTSRLGPGRQAEQGGAFSQAAGPRRGKASTYEKRRKPMVGGHSPNQKRGEQDCMHECARARRIQPFVTRRRRQGVVKLGIQTLEAKTTRTNSRTERERHEQKRRYNIF